MKQHPHFSIVMPNFNGGMFLEDALRSVIHQDFRDFELIVIDGESTDGSRDILERFRRFIDVLIIEPDQGQADAIMKGARIARGDLFNWINSDDMLVPGALKVISERIGNAGCLAGAVEEMDQSGKPTGIVRQRRLTIEGILLHPWRGSSYHQPGVWLRRKPFLACGGLDCNLHFAFDREMMIRFLGTGASVRITDRPLARFRLHSASKTVSQPIRFVNEQQATLQKFADQGPPRLRRIARTHLERLSWWRELEKIKVVTDRGDRLAAAAHIVRGVLANPRTRAGRASLRALAKVLGLKR